VPQQVGFQPQPDGGFAPPPFPASPVPPAAARPAAAPPASSGLTGTGQAPAGRSGGDQPFRRPRSGAESPWAAFAQPWLEPDPAAPPAGVVPAVPAAPPAALAPAEAPASGRATVVRGSASVPTSPAPSADEVA